MRKIGKVLLIGGTIVGVGVIVAHVFPIFRKYGLLPASRKYDFWEDDDEWYDEDFDQFVDEDIEKDFDQKPNNSNND